MDQIKTGRLIAELRKQKNLTQEELGKKLGVTNKTVSRWENGNYMPDVETLRLLAAEFQVSMEELLDGVLISEREERPVKKESFTQEERNAFWKQNWKRENRSWIILAGIFVIIGMPACYLLHKYMLGAAVILAAVILRIFFYNKMMAYVERNAYKLKD